MDDDFAASAEYSRIFARILNIKSDELSVLLKDTSLSEEQFLTHEGYISWSDQKQIIQNALRWSNTPGLGLITASKTPQPSSHGVLGVAAMSCETAMEALQTLETYQSIRAQFSHTYLTESDNQISIGYGLVAVHEDVATFLIEAWIVSLATILSLLLGSDVRMVRLELSFAKPSYAELFEKYIPCKIYYDQPIIQFLLPREFGDKIIPTHNAHIKRWALELCEQQLQTLNNKKSFAERARSIMQQTNGQPPQQETIANQLNVSARTFSRRLKEEGLTYKQLVDEEQKRLARHYFDNTKLNIETISGLVGYQDLSSFRRAFKRWFQMTPSQYPR